MRRWRYLILVATPARWHQPIVRKPRSSLTLRSQREKKNEASTTPTPQRSFVAALRTKRRWYGMSFQRFVEIVDWFFGWVTLQRSALVALCRTRLYVSHTTLWDQWNRPLVTLEVESIVLNLWRKDCHTERRCRCDDRTLPS